MVTSDRWDQYAQDVPTFTQASQPYQWVEPTRSRPSRRVSMGAGGFGGVSGVGGGARGGVTATQRQKRVGDDFQAAWDRSEERA